MNRVEFRGITRRRTLPARGFPLFALALLALADPHLAAAAEAEPASPAEEGATADNAADNDDIISLAAYNVKADRIEDFGIRVRPGVADKYPKTVVGALLSRYAPIIYAVVPNTAAAKAGLQPGERILKSDGQSMVGNPFSIIQLRKWRKTQKKKWAEVAAGKTNVTWTLDIQTPATKAVRTVKLVVPTPPPHWGASLWRMPEGRSPANVADRGPLAERSRAILDNGIWISLNERCTGLLGLDFKGGLKGDFASGREPLGYEWHLGNEREGVQVHRMTVTQFRGRTDVFLETRGPGGHRVYLTSPSGALEKVWAWQDKKTGEASPEQVRAGFEYELDFWTTKVGNGTGRWPFEVKSTYDPKAIFVIFPPKDAVSAVEVIRPPAEEFLKLRAATEAERAMFTDAYGKLGADPDQWAYTETSHGLEDKRVTVTRVDPSKPEAERCVLVSIDGKTPKPADVQAWRDDGGDTPKALGDLPSLASIVDLQEVRVFQDETAAVVFELPIRSGSAEFPAEKFQAHFRVNKTHRSFEDITVKLRNTFRVAGVVKVTDAGLDMRFQTFDPALAPQPVWFKAGGGVRVLLVKFSRSFEATRTDYKRVVPFDGAAVPAM
jgi:hypothetical protein